MVQASLAIHERNFVSFFYGDLWNSIRTFIIRDIHNVIFFFPRNRSSRESRFVFTRTHGSREEKKFTESHSSQREQPISTISTNVYAK